MKKEYIILLLGYTGQGKTSFLNFLYNVETVLKEFDGINQCEEFNDNSKENEQNYKMSSKTSAVTQYLSAVRNYAKTNEKVDYGCLHELWQIK